LCIPALGGGKPAVDARRRVDFAESILINSSAKKEGASSGRDDLPTILETEDLKH